VTVFNNVCPPTDFIQQQGPHVGGEGYCVFHTSPPWTCCAS
jgi:hypothetical protein